MDVKHFPVANLRQRFFLSFGLQRGASCSGFGIPFLFHQPRQTIIQEAVSRSPDRRSLSEPGGPTSARLPNTAYPHNRLLEDVRLQQGPLCKRLGVALDSWDSCFGTCGRGNGMCTNTGVTRFTPSTVQVSREQHACLRYWANAHGSAAVYSRLGLPYHWLPRS